MTTITIPETILSQIKPGDRAVEVCDTNGRIVGYFAPVATSDDYRQLIPPADAAELDRRSRVGGGRQLADVLRDIESGRRP